MLSFQNEGDAKCAMVIIRMPNTVKFMLVKCDFIHFALKGPFSIDNILSRRKKVNMTEINERIWLVSLRTKPCLKAKNKTGSVIIMNATVSFLRLLIEGTNK